MAEKYVFGRVELEIESFWQIVQCVRWQQHLLNILYPLSLFHFYSQRFRLVTNRFRACLRIRANRRHLRGTQKINSIFIYKSIPKLSNTNTIVTYSTYKKNPNCNCDNKEVIFFCFFSAFIFATGEANLSRKNCMRRDHCRNRNRTLPSIANASDNPDLSCKNSLMIGKKIRGKKTGQKKN